MPVKKSEQQLIAQLIRERDEARALVISGFYDGPVPVFEQGWPWHELQAVVTADEVTGYVQKIQELLIAQGSCGWYGDGRGACLKPKGHSGHHTCEEDGRLLAEKGGNAIA